MNSYEELRQFSLGIQAIKWSDSFEMYGERSPAGQWGNPSDYKSYNKFKAKCKLCDSFTEITKYSDVAKSDHFFHCAKEHGYIYPESSSVVVLVEDPVFQAIIQDSQIYELPMPGFDDHSRCIKQYKGAVVLCIKHENN